MLKNKNKERENDIRKSMRLVLGRDGHRNADQKRVFDFLVTNNIYKTTVEEQAVAHTARDFAVKIHRYLTEEKI